MRKVTIALACIVLSGCVQFRAAVSSRGAEVADAQLESAEWAECKLPSAAALERKYNLFSDPGNPKAKAWRALCYGVTTQ